MKFGTDKEKKSFTNCLQELREETNHKNTFIEGWQMLNLKWIWRKAPNKASAKSWLKVELGWEK